MVEDTHFYFNEINRRLAEEFPDLPVVDISVDEEWCWSLVILRKDFKLKGFIENSNEYYNELNRGVIVTYSDLSVVEMSARKNWHTSQIYLRCVILFYV